MRQVLAIAKNTFRQAIRDKILYGILLFAFLFIGSTVILGTLSLEENDFIIKTFGLAGIYIFGLIITVFLGASLIYDEIENRTTYIVLAKPVTRTSLILGKFLGLFGAVFATTLLMSLAYVLIVFSNGGKIDGSILLVVALQMMEMAILISALILFSILTTPLASTILTILIIYIGHSLGLILEYASKTGGIIRPILTFIYYLSPNLEKFNIRNLVAHNTVPQTQTTLIGLVYAVLYTALILHIAGLAFRKKDL